MQNTYHVTNENIAPSEVTNNVGDERGDASGASSSLVAWKFIEYYLGVPWESPILGSCHSSFSTYLQFTQNLKTSITQNITKPCEICQYDKEQSISLLVLSKTIFIIVSTQFLLQNIISTIYIEQYKPQKQANYALKTESVKNRTVCSNL